MKLNEAYKFSEEKIIVETTANELVSLFNDVKTGKKDMSRVMSFLKNGINYTKGEHPTFIINNLGAEKNWVDNFIARFPANDQKAAKDFITKVLKMAKENANTINADITKQTNDLANSKANRHQKTMSRIKTNVEFHGYGR